MSERITPIVSPEANVKCYFKLQENLLNLAESNKKSVSSHLRKVEEVLDRSHLSNFAKNFQLMHEEMRAIDGWGSSQAMEKGLAQDMGIDREKGKAGGLGAVEEAFEHEQVTLIRNWRYLIDNENKGMIPRGFSQSWLKQLLVDSEKINLRSPQFNGPVVTKKWSRGGRSYSKVVTPHNCEEFITPSLVSCKGLVKTTIPENLNGEVGSCCHGCGADVKVFVTGIRLLNS